MVICQFTRGWFEVSIRCQFLSQSWRYQLPAVILEAIIYRSPGNRARLVMLAAWVQENIISNSVDKTRQQKSRLPEFLMVFFCICKLRMLIVFAKPCRCHGNIYIYIFCSKSPKGQNIHHLRCFSIILVDQQNQAYGSCFVLEQPILDGESPCRASPWQKPAQPEPS